MNTKDKTFANEKVAEILNRFVGELNSPETRRKIAFAIKESLEENEIDYETVNLYTSPERVEDGFIDIRVDDELFPFSEIEELDENTWHEYIFKWESGRLGEEDTIKLFQYLIDEGHAWSLQGFYGRTAEDLIEAGFCTLSHKETTGHYIWGNPKIPTKYDLEPGAPGTDEYVQKRRELSDDDFIAWVGEQQDMEE